MVTIGPSSASTATERIAILPLLRVIRLPCASSMIRAPRSPPVGVLSMKRKLVTVARTDHPLPRILRGRAVLAVVEPAEHDRLSHVALDERDEHLVAEIRHPHRAVPVASVELADTAPIGFHAGIEPGQRELDPRFVVRIVDSRDQRLVNAVEALVGRHTAGKHLIHVAPASLSRRTSKCVV
jgi:hypothetical protein